MDDGADFAPIGALEPTHAGAARRSRQPSGRIGLPVALLATALAAVVFAAWPRLDLATAALFHDSNGQFVARGWTINYLRRAGDLAPFVVYAAMVVAGALRQVALRGLPGPTLRGIAFLSVSFVLGPGLLVNVGLKDHAHRPRPGQVIEFGGKATFQPYYRFDGGCEVNCSFVSGEVSSAAWTLAPALLSPPALRPVAVAAAVAFAVAMSLLRIAAGGHFLSDAIFAVLFTMIVVLALHRLLCGARRGRGWARLARGCAPTIVAPASVAVAPDSDPQSSFRRKGPRWPLPPQTSNGSCSPTPVASTPRSS